jgi:aquaporin Z
VQAFGIEVVITFLLMFVVLNVSTGAMEKGMMAGVAVGGTIAVAALFAGPVSGASMNPARSLGPAFVAGRPDHLWLYLVAPTVGALLASPMCRFFQGDTCCPDP